MNSKRFKTLLIHLSMGLLYVMSDLALSQVDPAWTKAAPMPQGSEELFAGVANDKLYLFGGYVNWGPRGLVYEYDPGTDKWAQKKQMPLPAHHTAIVGHNGKIYVFGGFAKSNTSKIGWLPIDNAWEYDPVQDEWKALPPMPTARGSANAVLYNDRIYVIGGAGMHPGVKPETLYAGDPHRSLSTVESFDLNTHTWSTHSPMPTARNHMGAGLIDGKIYTIGGRIGSVFILTASNTDIVEVYDPKTDSWGGTKTRMPTPRSGGAWGVYKGKIYYAGGEYQDSRLVGTFRAFEAYEPATNTWTILPYMPLPRHGVGGAFIGNKFHLVSGDVQSAIGLPFTVSIANHDIYEVKD